MSRLLVGPWVGELGWELMKWQSVVRAMSRKYDYTIVSSRPGHEFLYKDFMSEYIPFNIERATDCSLYNGRHYNEQLNSLIKVGDYHLKAQNFNPIDFKTGMDDEFIKFGTYINDPKYKYDLVIHARTTNKCGTLYKNWEVKKWNGLVKKLNNKYKIASIGRSTAAVPIEGTENRLDITLEELCNILASSRLFISSSSGPVHLAALCETEHLVICLKRDIGRHIDWNPFNTKHKLLYDYDWDPPVDYILENVEDVLCHTNIVNIK